MAFPADVMGLGGNGGTALFELQSHEGWDAVRKRTRQNLPVTGGRGGLGERLG